jgi:galactoside O-acetyltransferase
MEETSFYTRTELSRLGLAAFGEQVLISRKCSIYRPETISLGHHVRIDDFCVLSGGEGIRLGNYIHIGCFCALYGGAGIVMGDYSGLAARVAVYSESDDFSGASMTNPTVAMAFKPGYRRGAVVLRRHALIGTNATVLPGVVLDDGAAVGAHSLVIRSCRAWSFYMGSPAVRVQDRKRDILELERRFLAGGEPSERDIR